MTEINRLLSLRRTEQCLNDVRAWMGDNQLKVNDDKTVALVLSSHNNRANHITVIKIGDCDITPSPTGRNTGVIFDTEMSMVSHVKHVCCTPYYHLRNIASIRPCLPQKAAVRLVYSLVISRIDYANYLLYDLPQCLISKLQRVQNAAARLVVRCHTSSHETTLAPDETTSAVLNSASGVSCTTSTGATVLHRPAWTKSYESVTLNHKHWLLRAAISQPIRW